MTTTVADDARRMDDVEFIDLVAGATGLDREAAERAARATLRTLAERVGRHEARQVVLRLPPEIGGWFVAEAGHAEGFDVDEVVRRGAERGGGGRAHPEPRMSAAEFLIRVAQRIGVAVREGGRYTWAVFATLRETVPEEYFDADVHLPGDYDDLMGRP